MINASPTARISERLPQAAWVSMAWLVSVLTASCGGGGGAATTAPTAPSPSPAPGPAPTPAPTLQQRVNAATATASANPDCQQSTLGDFYWEVGDAKGPLASGSAGTTVGATTVMPIASASKWLYSAYVVQQRQGAPLASDIPYLNFTSGYLLADAGGPGSCQQTDTVSSCLSVTNSNPTASPAAIGKFAYDSGHMEVHANNAMGLGSDGDKGLNATVLALDFGSGVTATAATYTQPLLAGGVATSASTYGVFLRQILAGGLKIGGLLGADKVCTNPPPTGTCATAVSSPITVESWNYSLGHWVEDDPAVGDHAFSSAGAFGFYPWIDSRKTYYGILARNSGVTGNFEGYRSAQCGRLIRQAWLTGVQVTATTPTP